MVSEPPAPALSLKSSSFSGFACSVRGEERNCIHSLRIETNGNPWFLGASGSTGADIAFAVGTHRNVIMPSLNTAQNKQSICQSQGILLHTTRWMKVQEQLLLTVPGGCLQSVRVMRRQEQRIYGPCRHDTARKRHLATTCWFADAGWHRPDHGRSYRSQSNLAEHDRQSRSGLSLFGYIAHGNFS